MKNLSTCCLLFILSFTACKNKEQNPVDIRPVTTTSYAELSIAQGGEWEESVYKNRTAFKNIESLKVPPQHTDHSYFLRYEGPGWESDLVGYRLYLDWRNAIDVFGKKTPASILNQVGQDNFDSYHKMSNWGMDVLKVGKALGLGSYGRLIADSVYHFQTVDSTFIAVQNSDKASSVNINYYGWQTENIKTNLNANFSIKPGSRLTKVSLTGFTPSEGLVTGIVNHPGTRKLTGTKNSKWNYIATYGKQSLVPDNLGLVVFFKNEEVSDTPIGKYDHLIKFSSKLKKIEYYFAATWEQEVDGIKNLTAFENYLNETVQQLNNK